MRMPVICGNEKVMVEKVKDGILRWSEHVEGVSIIRMTENSEIIQD